MPPAPSRTDAEAREVLAAELDRLAPRRAALGDAGAHQVAGWTLMHAYEFEAAALAWSRAHELDPRDVKALFHDGLCRLELGRTAEAAERFRRAIELDREVGAGSGEGLDWLEEDPALRLGNCLHADGDLQGAVAAYEESVSRSASGVEALREIVRCRLALGDPKAALGALRRLEGRTVRLSLRAEVLALRAEAEEALARADGR